MSALLWRILIAAICLVLVFALIPPLIELTGLMVPAALILIMRICAVGIAVLYVLVGRSPV